jgi:PAS domain S-box-containing protein
MDQQSPHETTEIILHGKQVKDLDANGALLAILQARLRLSDAAATHTLEELLQKVLDEAEALTGRCIGFFHFLEKDQQTLSLQAWSSNTLQTFCTAEGKGLHYNVDTAGVWVDCIRQRRPVIHNDYAELPHRKGVPAGHPAVIRELVVPIFRDEQIVAVFGVGNKKQAYDQRDIELVSTLGDMARDIVFRKLDEAALQESEKNYREIFNSTSEAIVIHDAGTGKIIDVNETTLRMYGYCSRETLLAGNIGDLSANIPPYTEQDAQERIKKCIDEGPHVFDWLAKKNTGERFWVEVSLRKSETGGKGKILAVVRDITERKRMEAEKAVLEAQNRQLQKAESLGRMAGAIAHHFNNQLQTVMGNLEMAMNDLPQGSAASESLTEALKAAHKAAVVSGQMLSYLGQTPCRHEPLDLSESCRQSLALLQAAAPKGMIIDADFPSSGPIIRANAGQIMQVLTNLATNAWEAADENRSCIGMTVKTVSRMDIPSSKRFPIDWQPRERDYACLEVADAGCGIAHENIEKLFDPFYSTKFTGRGMGLSVVLGIVKAHNGGITVESEPGRGSVFRIFLPVSTEEVQRQPDKPILSPEIQGGGTVLLIEDEDQVRKMARTMLTHLGYRVLEAKDGAEAMDIFQQHQEEIRCVLSDLTMPRMNGWEALAAMRKLSPDIPVILSSGYDEAHVMADEHPERPNAFLGKPYRLQELGDTIRCILSDRGDGL